MSNRFWPVLIGIALSVLAIFASAVPIPRLLIESSPRFSNREQTAFAEYSLRETRSALAGTAEPIFLVDMKVITVTLLEPPQPSSQFPDLHCDCMATCGTDYGYEQVRSNYEAVVRAYTFFGIPYTLLKVSCEGLRRI